MKYIFTITDEGMAGLRVLDEADAVVRDIPRVWTMREAGRHLNRTQRHLYRYVQRGWLRPAAKFSGEFFFDPSEVKLLKKRARKRVNQLPSWLAPLFPEYDIENVHLDRDADLILSRLLDRGDGRAARWVLRHFTKNQRRDFLRRQGRRLLSKRSLGFWCWLWNTPVPRENVEWREKGLGPGGIQ